MQTLFWPLQGVFCDGKRVEGNACWHSDITEHRCYSVVVKNCHKSESGGFERDRMMYVVLFFLVNSVGMCTWHLAVQKRCGLISSNERTK